MRKLSAVIAAVYEHVPVEEESFKAGLENIHSSVCFAPPENAGLWWREFCEFLESQIPNPSENWHNTISEIVSGKRKVLGQ